MNSRLTIALLALVFVVLSAHRLPAPISEVETPTPAQEQSAKPKPERTIKPDVATDKSESSTRRQMPSPAPKSQATLQRNPFDGTWGGFLAAGDYRTLVINATGTVVTEKSVKWGTATWPATCDSVSMKWKTAGGCSWTLTPNADGKTAVAMASCPGFLGVGAGSWSATFQKAAQ